MKSIHNWPSVHAVETKEPRWAIYCFSKKKRLSEENRLLKFKDRPEL
ncbi:hypothetical protein N9022_00570 [bacterium]|nr:hypothetical protein [bacterium]